MTYYSYGDYCYSNYLEISNAVRNTPSFSCSSGICSLEGITSCSEGASGGVNLLSCIVNFNYKPTGTGNMTQSVYSHLFPECAAVGPLSSAKSIGTLLDSYFVFDAALFGQIIEYSILAFIAGLSLGAIIKIMGPKLTG